MRQLNWQEVQNLSKQLATLHTKTGIPFQVVFASDETLTVRVRSGKEHSISRVNLEKAIRILQKGVILEGPKDYLEQVADDRPAYAWAILRELGYLKS